MKCVDSRPTPQGYRRRRYVDEHGVTTVTIEVPLAVWNGINKQGRDSDRAAAFLRGRERARKRTIALAQAAEGWKAIASASALGVPVRTVERWRAAAR